MRLAAVCLLAATLAVGCGGGQAHDALSETAGNLGKIHSGDLTLRLVVAPREGTKGRIGFELRGPFALRAGRLPIAKVAYTQIAGAREATATFISTGSKAYAEVNGKVRELPPASTESIRQAAAGGSGGIGGLDIGSWVKNPQVTSEGDLDHITADLDVVNATNGLPSKQGRSSPHLWNRHLLVPAVPGYRIHKRIGCHVSCTASHAKLSEFIL